MTFVKLRGALEVVLGYCIPARSAFINEMCFPIDHTSLFDTPNHNVNNRFYSGTKFMINHVESHL